MTNIGTFRISNERMDHLVKKLFHRQEAGSIHPLDNIVTSKDLGIYLSHSNFVNIYTPYIQLYSSSSNNLELYIRDIERVNEINDFIVSTFSLRSNCYVRQIDNESVTYTFS